MDAKGSRHPPHDVPPRTRTSILKRSLMVFALLVATVITLKASPGIWFPTGNHTGPVSNTANKDFSWEKLTAKSDLAYTDCYDGHECANLELPMDWWNGTTDAKISLAVIRLPAEVPVTDPRYGGAVLVNPGGPGGSGISMALKAGKGIQETISSEEKKFDVVSFDPRGVGDSKPAIQCVKSLQYDHSWQVRVMEEGVFEASDAALGRLWSMSTARSKSCALPLEDGQADIRKYVTTASVARDMLEIVEKHGEWREKEAKRLLVATSRCGKHTVLAGAQSEVPDALIYKPGQEKIQYWGFSYGTYLGNTFAAMFPNRIHRLVVDGVVDAYNYKQTLWSDNLFDTEKDMNQLYHHCARAGHPACALANPDGSTTPSEVRYRITNLTTTLLHNPLPVIGPNPEVITYSDVKNLIFAGLYTPIKSFPYIANLLADLLQNNGTRFAALLKPYHAFSCPAQPGQGYSIIPLNNATKHGGLHISYDATMAIACTDGDDQGNLTKPAFAAYARELASISPSIGSMWSTVRLHCIHYSIRPYFRFEGPWEAKTSHQVLMIGNTMDPVTPVRNAHKMAKGFEGAVVLTQDSAGHCSSSAFSNCTIGYLKRYFGTGELPEPGVICEADELPFGPGFGSGSGSGSGGDSDVKMLSGAGLGERQRHASIAVGLRDAGGAFVKPGFAGLG